VALPPTASPPETKASAPEAAAIQPAPAQVPEKPAAPLLAPEQLRRFEGYSAARNPLLRERIAGAREKLEGEPDTSYSIELFVAENSDAARAERFLVRARELVPLSEVYVIPVATGSRYFLRVAYGAYTSKEAAADAAKRLPPKYQKAFAFQLRSYAELRGSI
jgi:septal ring-binding cell division protein DamX